jgi:NAD(P)-dependent dehydrogenase (short-subunit alcohol dehydrogenase family)
MKQGGRIVVGQLRAQRPHGKLAAVVGMGGGKAALEAPCRCVAVALAKRGITVNVVSPALTEVSVLSGLPREVEDTAPAWHARGSTPMARLGTPADIGSAVTLLRSEEASWITGQMIHVDGRGIAHGHRLPTRDSSC